MTKNEQTIAQKIAQLDQLLAWFESDDVNVEQALVKYEQAQVLARDLELELTKAQNQIEVIKKKFA